MNRFEMDRWYVSLDSVADPDDLAPGRCQVIGVRDTDLTYFWRTDFINFTFLEET